MGLVVLRMLADIPAGVDGSFHEVGEPADVFCAGGGAA